MDHCLAGNLTAITKGAMVFVQAASEVHHYFNLDFLGTLLYGYSVLPIKSLIHLLVACYEKELTEI